MNAFFIVCGLGFVSLIAELINFRRGLHLLIVAGLVTAIWFAIPAADSPIFYFSNMLSFDAYATVFTGLLVIVALCWFLSFSSYFIGEEHQTDRGALVLFCTAGGIMMVSFHNLAVLFLGIEILSISLYVLAGSTKDSFFSNEAAFKYFIMGSFATGFLLMGIALVYGYAGSFDIGLISTHLQTNQDSLPGFLIAGTFLMFIGLAFKVSVVPFHFWAPDVYSGAPTAITAFMSTVVKIAALAAFVKIFGYCFASLTEIFTPVLNVLIVLTLIVANISAVYQKSVKRMLAYSSIAHVGYIFIGFVSSRGISFEPVLLYYLASYAGTSLISFACVMIVEKQLGSSNLQAFRGLFAASPFLSICFIIAMLSLAGIPPLSGFFAKYLILVSAIDAGLTWIALVAVGASLVGVYYYFKPVIALFAAPESPSKITLSVHQRLVLGLLTLVIALMGILPEYILRIAR
jgi:NADH-quinone oxidoreductase subunit N